MIGVNVLAKPKWRIFSIIIFSLGMEVPSIVLIHPTIFIFLFIKIIMVEFGQELIMKTLNLILNINSLVSNLKNKTVAYDINVNSGKELKFLNILKDLMILPLACHMTLFIDPQLFHQ